MGYTVGAPPSAVVTVNDNDVADATPPTLSTAVVNGNTLVLTYSETLDAASTPAASAFALGGTSVSVNTVAISGAVVTLTLSSAVAFHGRGDGELHGAYGARHEPVAGRGG